MRRLFRKTERRFLASLTDGQCAICECDLPQGFHADHIQPWRLGGQTTIENGQALCPECNLKKGGNGPKPEKEMQNREWQDECLEKLTKTKDDDFLVVATPGAGKTHLALTYAAHLKQRGEISRVIVVAHSTNIKIQWCRAAGNHGLKMSSDINFWRGEDGFAVTYQALSNNVNRRTMGNATLMRKTLVIFDEIHHAAEVNSFGLNVIDSFSKAHKRLCLSGTPFRSDQRKIAWIKYDDVDGNLVSHADFRYDYPQALFDGVVREVRFPMHEGEVDYIRHGVEYHAILEEENEGQSEADILHAACVGKFIESVFLDADRKLLEIRRGKPSAAGLMVCRNTEHAEKMGSMIRRQTGQAPLVVHCRVNEDKEKAEKVEDELKAFRRNDDPRRWLVAVDMVSEGVDIPRLMVGIYATNKTTEMYFQQFVGRFVRSERPRENAYIFMPDIGTLRELAAKFCEQRDHVIDQLEENPAEWKKPDGPPPPYPVFQALGGVSQHSGTIFVDGLRYSAEELQNAEEIKQILELDDAPEKIIRSGKLDRLKDLFSGDTQPPKSAVVDIEDEVIALRRSCNEWTGKIVGKADRDEYKNFNKYVNDRFGVTSIKEQSVEGLRERNKFLKDCYTRKRSGAPQ